MQQAPGFAEEESREVWPELLKPQTEQMVKSPQSSGWGFFLIAIPLAATVTRLGAGV